MFSTRSPQRRFIQESALSSISVLPCPTCTFTHSLSLTHTHSLTFLLVSAKRFSLLSSPRTLTLLIPGHNKTEPVTSCKDRRQQKKLL